MKIGLILSSLFAALTLQASAQETTVPKTEDQKVLYTVGIWLGQQAAPFGLTMAEFKYVQAGLRDSVQGKKPVVNTDIYGPKLNEFARSRMQARADAEKKKEASFLTKAAQEKGAKTTSSGLIFLEETPGTGATPKATDKVRVHYEGRLTNGTVFDSSIARGQPTEFPLNEVIPCWTEGLQLMKVGGKAKLVCPSKIAYGDRGMPPRIPGGSSLVFQIQLLDIVK
jgi:FKBP-type peptidyl-prolyl cis-trans isomerase FkpA